MHALQYSTHVGNFSNCDDAMIFDFFVVFFSFVSTTAATMGNGDKQETWTHTANLKTSQAKPSQASIV
jgi:hypothetical protein